MKQINVTIREIKAVKSEMDNLDKLKAKNEIQEENGTVSYNGKEKLINYHEKQIEKNVKIMSDILGIDYDTVIDMCYDLEFAKYVLADLKKKV